MYELPAKPASAAVEKKIIKELDNKQFSPASTTETWFLISEKWFAAWKDYVLWDDDSGDAFDRPAPGPINNKELLPNEFPMDKPVTTLTLLRKHLIESHDYRIIPKSVWETLHHWYGGGPAVPRGVIAIGDQKKLIVELTPMVLGVSFGDAHGQPTQDLPVSFSKQGTLRQLRDAVCQQRNIDPSKVRPWTCFFGNNFRKLDEAKLDETLDDHRFQMEGQRILFEVQNTDGTWPRDKAAVTTVAANTTSSASTAVGLTSSSSSQYGRNMATQQRVTRVPPGVCGLNNLGNTCFMNSALQCLSNTPELQQYFFNDVYKQHINRKNPLGMKGQLAERFGELIHELWCGERSSVSPSDLKHVIGRFAPQFMGYAQQDSQELTAFLLDGLHEDLNLVVVKPYTETIESNGRPDMVVARESWHNHRQRNQSVIVDVFQGQYKSTLVCPEPHCQKVSITFDPFMYLSLPLPMERERLMDVILVRDASSQPCDPTRYGLKVPKQGRVGDLKQALAEQCGMTADRLVLTDVHRSSFYAMLPNTKRLEDIRDSDILVAYEVLACRAAAQGNPSTLGTRLYGEVEDDVLLLRVVHRKNARVGYKGRENFGIPFILSVKASEATVRDVYNMIRAHSEKLLPQPMETDQLEEEEVPYRLKVCGDSTMSSDEGKELPLSDEPINRFCRNLQLLAVDWVDNNSFSEEASVKIGDHESVHMNRRTRASEITLGDCLQLFTKAERLSPEDSWFCPSCKDFKQATKKLDLWKLPEILVVHLKRFQYSKYFRDKLDVLVDYPLESLDLSGFLSEEALAECEAPPVYDLYATSNHSGGLGGGHYTAYAKNKDDQHWYHFNDSSARQASENQIVSSSSYVLFYRRKDVAARASPVPMQH